MIKKVFACLLAALMLISVIACAKPATTETAVEATKEPVATAAPTKEPTAAPTAEPTPEPEPEPEPKDIVILYTNDIHCGVEDGIGFVGVARVKAALEAAGKEVILVDNGDSVQGDVIGTLSKGEAIIELMNDVGYDVAVIGNHDFDYGMDQFKKNVSLAKYQFVCCNFIDLTTNEPYLKPYTIIEKGGKKIAFVGVDTPESFTKSTPKYFQDAEGNFIYSFCEGNKGQDLYDKVQETVDAARAEGADYVIVLAHLGVDYQSSPWTASELIVNTTGIDAVLDGHSHTDFKLEYGKDFASVKNKDGNAVIHSSTGTKLANVGILTISGDKMSAKLLDASAMQFMDQAGLLTEDKGVGAIVKAAQAKNEELVNTVVAHTDVDLVIKDPVTGERIVRSQETNLGDLCADAYRAMGETDIAFVNGGGVRDTIPAGDVTYGQIIKVHPFGNALCTVEVTGQEILDALELSVASMPGESGGFLHVSGLKFTVDLNVDSTVVKDDKKLFVEVAGERRVKDVQVLQKDGTYAPLDPEKTYTLACHNYLLKDMGDGYTMFADNKFLSEDVMLDNQVLINYIVERLGGTVGADYVDPYGQGRITIIPKGE